MKPHKIVFASLMLFALSGQAVPKVTQESDIKPIAKFSQLNRSQDKKGFYVGIEAGASQAGFPSSYDTTNHISPNGATNTVTRMSGRLSPVNFLSRLYGGYWFPQTDKFLVGVQVGLNLHRYAASEFGMRTQPLSVPVIDNTTTTQIVSNGLGGSILGQLGYVLSPSSALYVGAGWSIAHFKLNTLYSESPFQTSTPSFSLFNASYKNGYSLSLALETWLRPHWSLMLHYLYSSFGKIRTAGSQRDGGPDSYTGTNTLKLRVSSFLVGLAYHFQKNALSNFISNSNFRSWLLNLGAASTSYRFSSNRESQFRTPNVNGGVHTLNYRTTPGFFGLQGEISLGRGLVIVDNRFFLGADVFVNFSDERSVKVKFSNEFSSVPTTDANYTATDTFKLNDIGFGFDLDPGILLNSSTLLYLKTGVAFNEATLNSEFLDVAGTGNITLHSNKNVYGFRWGLGIREMLKHGFALSLVYLATNYYPHRDFNFSQPPPTNGMENNNINVRIFSQQIMLKVGHTL